MGRSSQIDQFDAVMAEADELVQHINSMVADDIKETHHIELEKRLKKLENLKSEMQDMLAKQGEPDKSSSYADGFHEAYQEIVKAMKNLKELLN